eukprot:c4741_g1_i1 orf=381-716(-)
MYFSSPSDTHHQFAFNALRTAYLMDPPFNSSSINPTFDLPFPLEFPLLDFSIYVSHFLDNLHFPYSGRVLQNGTEQRRGGQHLKMNIVTILKLRMCQFCAVIALISTHRSL